MIVNTPLTRKIEGHINSLSSFKRSIKSFQAYQDTSAEDIYVVVVVQKTHNALHKNLMTYLGKLLKDVDHHIQPTKAQGTVLMYSGVPIK